VPHTAAQMYQLVIDIELYPQFVPWCDSCDVVTVSESSVRAAMKFARKGLSATWTTLNTNTPCRKVEMQLVTGPFKNLKGEWNFVSIDDHSSKVVLEMEFEFSNAILSKAFGSFFSQIANKLVSAFVARANQLYGSSPAIKS